jgi:hypothetical protein
MGPNFGPVVVDNPRLQPRGYESGRSLLLQTFTRSAPTVRRLSADERAARLRDTARLVESLGKTRREPRTAPRRGSRR